MVYLLVVSFLGDSPITLAPTATTTALPVSQPPAGVPQARAGGLRAIEVSPGSLHGKAGALLRESCSSCLPVTYTKPGALFLPPAGLRA